MTAAKVRPSDRHYRDDNVPREVCLMPKSTLSPSRRLRRQNSWGHHDDDDDDDDEITMQTLPQIPWFTTAASLSSSSSTSRRTELFLQCAFRSPPSTTLADTKAYAASDRKPSMLVTACRGNSPPLELFLPTLSPLPPYDDYNALFSTPSPPTTPSTSPETPSPPITNTAAPLCGDGVTSASLALKCIAQCNSMLYQKPQGREGEERAYEEVVRKPQPHQVDDDDEVKARELYWHPCFFEEENKSEGFQVRAKEIGALLEEETKFIETAEEERVEEEVLAKQGPEDSGKTKHPHDKLEMTDRPRISMKRNQNSGAKIAKDSRGSKKGECEVPEGDTRHDNSGTMPTRTNKNRFFLRKISRRHSRAGITHGTAKGSPAAERSNRDIKTPNESLQRRAKLHVKHLRSLKTTHTANKNNNQNIQNNIQSNQIIQNNNSMSGLSQQQHLNNKNKNTISDAKLRHQAEMKAQELRNLESTYTTPIQPVAGTEILEYKAFSKQFQKRLAQGAASANDPNTTNADNNEVPNNSDHLEENQEMHLEELFAILLDKHPHSIGKYYWSLVPSQVPHEEFWKRYLFRCSPRRIQRQWKEEQQEQNQSFREELQRIATTSSNPPASDEPLQRRASTGGIRLARRRLGAFDKQLHESTSAILDAPARSRKITRALSMPFGCGLKQGEVSNEFIQDPECALSLRPDRQIICDFFPHEAGFGGPLPPIDEIAANFFPDRRKPLDAPNQNQAESTTIQKNANKEDHYRDIAVDLSLLLCRARPPQRLIARGFPSSFEKNPVHRESSPAGESPLSSGNSAHLGTTSATLPGLSSSIWEQQQAPQSHWSRDLIAVTPHHTGEASPMLLSYLPNNPCKDPDGDPSAINGAGTQELPPRPKECRGKKSNSEAADPQLKEMWMRHRERHPYGGDISKELSKENCENDDGSTSTSTAETESHGRFCI